jgi:hypothetical protein
MYVPISYFVSKVIVAFSFIGVLVFLGTHMLLHKSLPIVLCEQELSR